MRLVEREQGDVNCSLVSVVLGMMGVTWDCLLSFLTTKGTMVGFPQWGHNCQLRESTFSRLKNTFFLSWLSMQPRAVFELVVKLLNFGSDP